MRLPPYVKPTPFLLKWVPRGITFYKLIFLRKDIYDDLLSKCPTYENVGILLHEQTHRKRMGRDLLTGVKHGIKFWLNPNFRAQEELAADRVRFSYLKKNRVEFDFNKRARDLAGIRYLWCMSFPKAKRELEKVWEEI